MTDKIFVQLSVHWIVRNGCQFRVVHLRRIESAQEMKAALKIQRNKKKQRSGNILIHNNSKADLTATKYKSYQGGKEDSRGHFNKGSKNQTKLIKDFKWLGHYTEVLNQQKRFLKSCLQDILFNSKQVALLGK